MAADVLRTADGGCSKTTRIVYKSSLSQRLMTRILDRLVNDGLVRIGRIKRGSHLHLGHSITDEGKRASEACVNLGALLNWRFHVELG
jgi:predicted transcriptional regulator